MFIGHFAAVHPLRRWYPETPAYVLTIGVTFLDLVFAVIGALWHLEGVTVDPSEGKLGVQLHCDYSHSLVGALLLSIGYGAAVHVLVGGGNRTARDLFAAGFWASISHWFEDWLVHNHDLLLDPWWTRATIGGTQLWSKFPTFSTYAELALSLAFGWWWVPEHERTQPRALAVNVLLLAVFHFMNGIAFPYFAGVSMSQPTVDLQHYGLSATMLVVFLVPALVIGWVIERRPRPLPSAAGRSKK